ncbi:MAG: hypothetical protein P1V51_22875 [Deltaproteobacteria bacterium]|nr:hypothetical protein [Deltaproteobacteria bacterium]
MQMLRLLPLAALGLALVGGCSTLSGARPLARGEHEAGLTLGGPLLKLGGAVLPIPSANLQGRSGLPALAGRPFDLDYGLGLTPLAFGIVQGHVGAGWGLLEEKGALPALTPRLRLFWGVALPGGEGDAEGINGLWGTFELALLASWSFGSKHLLVVGLSDYLDPAYPSLMLTPTIGGRLALGERWALELDVRYFSINRRPDARTVVWFPGGTGALGAAISISMQLGGAS